MIDWDSIADDGCSISERECLSLMGSQLKRSYLQFAVESGPSAEARENVFVQLMTTSVEVAATESAKRLRNDYEDMCPPRRDDSIDLGRRFVSNVLERFRDAICAEFWETADLAISGRDLIVVLVPTIVSLLDLPKTCISLSIPLSVILSKIGLRTVCSEYEQKRKNKEFLKMRLELHRKSLLFLEEEATHYSGKRLPGQLDRAISRERSAIHRIQKQMEA